MSYLTLLPRNKMSYALKYVRHIFREFPTKQVKKIKLKRIL